MSLIRHFAFAAGMLALSAAPGHAALQVIGDGITGDVAVADGATLWSLVENVQTAVAPGFNARNAILHNYVIAKSESGAISVFSLGELNPRFGGTNDAPFISVSGGDYTLVDPNSGASARGLDELTSLTVIAVSALPTGAGGASSSVALSGAVASPASSTLTDLEGFTPASATVGGSTYEGTSLYGFLDPTLANALTGIVVVGATDGYMAVFSLAELDTALGGNPDNLLAFAGATFPGSAVARLVLPDDNMHGRWVSNIDFIRVDAVPEPSTWAMILVGFAGFGLVGYRSRKAREVV